MSGHGQVIASPGPTPQPGGPREAWRWRRWTGWVTAGELLVFTAVATPLWQPGQPAAEIAVIGMLGGLLMAVTVAAITGWSMGRLLRNGLRPCDLSSSARES